MGIESGSSDDLNMLDLRIDAQIRSRSYGMLSIIPDGEQPPYTYTSGLVLQDVPDMIVMGAESALSERMIAWSMAPHRDAWPYRELPLGGLAKSFTFALRTIDPAIAHSEYMLNTARYSQRIKKPAVGAVQLLWPDAAGRLPTDPGCDPAVAVAQLRIPFA